MRFFKRNRKSTPARNPIMNTLIRPLMKFCHSKIGWLVNKIGLTTSAWLGSIGIESGDTTYQIAAGIGGLLFLSLEFVVKKIADKFVGDFQHRHGLTRDFWPGHKTRIVAKVDPATAPIQPD